MLSQPFNSAKSSLLSDHLDLSYIMRQSEIKPVLVLWVCDVGCNHIGHQMWEIIVWAKLITMFSLCAPFLLNLTYLLQTYPVRTSLHLYVFLHFHALTPSPLSTYLLTYWVLPSQYSPPRITVPFLSSSSALPAISSLLYITLLFKEPCIHYGRIISFLYHKIIRSELIDLIQDNSVTAARA